MTRRQNALPVPGLFQSLADQERFFNFDPPRLPSAARLCFEPSAREGIRHFSEQDDQRLRAIMMKYPGDLSPNQWRQVAVAFGDGRTARQLRERWFDYASPDLATGPLDLDERRQVAALVIHHPGQWAWIARQLGNGLCRSGPMVRAFVDTFRARVRKLGLNVQSATDIAFVPDAVFSPGRSSGLDRETLVARFNAAKARHAAAIAARIAPAAAGGSFGDDSGR
jgi:hypothetical protein